MLDEWNIQLFLALNAAANPDPLTVALAKAVAAQSIFLALAITAALWIWGPPRRRGALLAVATVLPFALVLNGIVGWLHFRPRPFMLGLGHTLVPHAAEAGFPSDHMSFLWTLGLSLLATAASRPAGWCIVVIGVPTAWARIYLGVHTPLDMLGSLGVAALAALLARAVLPQIERHLLVPAETLYIGALRALRLPDMMFPKARSGDGQP